MFDDIFFMWFINSLFNLWKFFFGITLLCVAGTVISGICTAGFKSAGDESASQISFKYFKRSICGALIFGFFNTISPTKDDIPFLLGGATVLAISENKEVQKLPENVVKVMNKFLEDYLVEEPIVQEDAQ